MNGDRLVVQVLQSDLKVPALPGLVRNDQTIGHYSFQLDDAEDAGGQQLLIEFKLADAPEKRRNGVQVIMNKTFAALRKLLEMLRRQQHAFMPLNRLRYLPAIHHAFICLLL